MYIYTHTYIHTYMKFLATLPVVGVLAAIDETQAAKLLTTVAVM
jgi:hypothetical protein